MDGLAVTPILKAHFVDILLTIFAQGHTIGGLAANPILKAQVIDSFAANPVLKAHVH